MAETGVTSDPSLQASMGIPDQNSMTLVAMTLNVPTWGLAGVTTTITVFLVEQLDNSSTIADGIIVYFAAEGGAIGSIVYNGQWLMPWSKAKTVQSSAKPSAIPISHNTGRP